MKKRLAIVTTHPIQYNAPVFRMLSERGVIDCRVYYTWGESVLQNKYDPGFGKVIEWDIPLLQGYDFVMVRNVSNEPGSHHFKGIINPSLNREIAEWNPDAVLVFGWSFSSHLSCMRHFHGKIPVFFRGDSTLLDSGKGKLKNFIRKIFLKYVYHNADLFLFAGKENKSYFKYAGVNETKLVFAPHAIENERFSNTSLNDFRKIIGLPSDAFVFLFAGKFEKKKNPLLLITSFAELTSSKSHLVLTGNGPMETELRLFVGDLHESIRQRIHFVEFQNQSIMPDVYKCCDVFVLPSRGPGETWGLAINEAMASGKAVIVSNKCGCSSDLVDEGKNGFVFESDNKDNLIQKMSFIDGNREMASAFGKASFEKIKSWSFKVICDVIENSMKKINSI